MKEINYNFRNINFNILFYMHLESYFTADSCTKERIFLLKKQIHAKINRFSCARWCNISWTGIEWFMILANTVRLMHRVSANGRKAVWGITVICHFPEMSLVITWQNIIPVYGKSRWINGELNREKYTKMAIRIHFS